MTLAEATLALDAVDCHDLDAVRQALAERARAIAEFAATATRDALLDTLESGAQLLERLERVRIDSMRDLDRMVTLHRGLQSNFDPASAAKDQVTCFG